MQRARGTWLAVLVLSGCAMDVGEATESLAVPGPWVLPPDVRREGETQYVHYDSPGAWNDGANCSGRLLEGTRELGDFLVRRFPQIRFYGGYSCRRNTGNLSQMSVHGTGRALDLMLPMDGGDADNGKGDPVANWLVTHAQLIGVQYEIWDHWDWNASLSGRKDTPYGGPIPHIDHIHMELSQEGARRDTRWFTDRDGDDVRNGRDNCPNDANAQQEDRDEDGVGNRCDICPADPNPGQRDSDGDGIGDRCDNCSADANTEQNDDDGDGRGNRCDNCDAVTNPGQRDTDGDGRGDACDGDDDDDGVRDENDNCALVGNAAQNDADGDGVGNACEDDDDGDTIRDANDNCPRIANPNQVDSDRDGRGDACDDSDGDGVFDREDVCPNRADPAQSDLDGDGIGDACDDDRDGDALRLASDPCPEAAGSTADQDGDGIGDACDPDADGDEALDDGDVCPALFDPDQADSDADGIGDACDATPTVSDMPDPGAIHEHDDEEAMADVQALGEAEPPAGEEERIELDPSGRDVVSGCSVSRGAGGSSLVFLFGALAAWLTRRRRR